MKLATIPKKAKPQEGDYKIEKRFAWWPRIVEDKLIWLEKYKRVHIWKVRKRIIMIPGVYKVFDAVYGDWDFVTEQLIKK